MDRRFTLAYFSGTGSTKAVCDCFEQQLVSMGIDCPNTACRLYCKRILTQKGYRVIYEQMIVMPSNIAVQAERLNAALIAVLPEKVKKITDDILSERERLTKPSPAAKLCALIGKAGGGAFKSFTKYIEVTEMCQGCGICARNCPKKNISMEKGKPVFGENCTMCLGCIYGCPEEALALRKMKFIVIKGGYNLDKMATQGNPEPGEEDYKPYRGLIWKGVIEYLEK